MFRVLVTGCRYWQVLDLARSILARLEARHGPDLLIVHGDCPTGVDASFSKVCMERGIVQEAHPADWDTLGRGAGPVRNEAMVEAGAAICLAVHRDLAGSKGTLGCVRLALAAGIPVWLVDSEAGEPRKITEAPTGGNR